MADQRSEEVKNAFCLAEEEFNIVMVSDGIKEESGAYTMADQCSEEVKNAFCPAGMAGIPSPLLTFKEEEEASSIAHQNNEIKGSVNNCTGRKNPRFNDSELSVMVDEIIRVEPQLLGSQMQHTPASMKRQMWVRIVDKVNAVANNLRTQDEIRKRWNDLRRRVRSLASKRRLETLATGGGSPRPPVYIAPWEEKVLGIMHPEGLYVIEGGVETGPTAVSQDTTPATAGTSTQPSEQAFRDVDFTGSPDEEDPAGPSGQAGLTAPVSLTGPTSILTPPLLTTSMDTSTTCVPSTNVPIMCPPVLAEQVSASATSADMPGPSGSGHARARAQVSGLRVRGRDSVGPQSEDTGSIVTQATLDQVFGAIHHSEDSMGQVISELREMKQLMREHNIQSEQMLREHNLQMENLNSNLGSLTGVLHDVLSHLFRGFPIPTSPLCGLQTSVGKPSASTTEMEALPGRQSPPPTSVPETVHPEVPFRRGRSSRPAVEDAQTTSTTSKKHKS